MTEQAVPRVHQRASGRSGWLLGLIVFAAALALIVLRITALSRWSGVRLNAPWLMTDFKSAIFCPVALFLQGGNPYSREQYLHFCPVQDVFPLYLPATLILHAPFGVLSINAAAVVYFVATIALSVFIVMLALRLTSGEATVGSVLLGAGLLLLSRPGQWNLLLGQPALELAIATYVAMYWARRAPLLSGLAVAVTLYKPTFGVPLAVLMLVRGDGRAVAAAAVFAAILNVPPLLVLLGRSGGLDPFIQELLRSQRAWQDVVNPAALVWGVDLPSLVAKALGVRLAPGAYVALSLAVLGATAAALRSLRHTKERLMEHLSASLICLGILLSLHHHGYDLVLLVAPIVAVATSRLPAGFLLRWRRLTVLGLFALLGANYATTLSVLQHLTHQRAAWLVLASANAIILLAIFLVYVAGSIGIGRSPSGPSESSAVLT
ncbi:MAG: DUF2029 domain-containing protein [Gemmatimonadales bacterium]|nr:DUF2029 domain-containing protein [Gemmatimonadales bacterium]